MYAPDRTIVPFPTETLPFKVAPGSISPEIGADIFEQRVSLAARISQGLPISSQLPSGTILIFSSAASRFSPSVNSYSPRSESGAFFRASKIAFGKRRRFRRWPGGGRICALLNYGFEIAVLLQEYAVPARIDQHRTADTAVSPEAIIFRKESVSGRTSPFKTMKISCLALGGHQGMSRTQLLFLNGIFDIHIKALPSPKCELTLSAQ